MPPDTSAPKAAIARTAARAKAPKCLSPTVGLAPGHVQVRMYRQGLGDCFLVSIGRADKPPFRMMVDCGVLLGTGGKESLMQNAVRNIAQTTKGALDVLAVTHEHYDHVSGFVLAKAEFDGGTDANPTGLKARETWFAWTEDPDDPLGQRIRKARTDRIEKLQGLVQAMGARPSYPDLAEDINGILDFFGATGNRQGDTVKGMEKARQLGVKTCYLRPDQPPRELPDLPGIRVWALGPPRDEALLRKTFARDAVYHLAGGGDCGAAALFGAAGLRGDQSRSGDRWAPFDAAYCHPLHAPPDGKRPSRSAEAFLYDHYWGSADDPQHPDQDWRRIGEDWLGSASDFALQLDAATNNTSLVLAIEGIKSGKVLLLAADAQVGNWQSWKDLSWTVEGRTVTGPELLARTVFYKVSHHGSQNATLDAGGLELMPDGLVAFLPVDHEMAVCKHWDDMPLPGLLDALGRKCGGQVVRMDKPFPDALGGAKAAAHFPLRDPDCPGLDGPLYYQWEASLA